MSFNYKRVMDDVTKAIDYLENNEVETVDREIDPSHNIILKLRWATFEDSDGDDGITKAMLDTLESKFTLRLMEIFSDNTFTFSHEESRISWKARGEQV